MRKNSKEEKVNGKVIVEEKAKKQLEANKEKFEKQSKNKENKKKEKVNKIILTILLVLIILVVAIGIIFGGRIINKAKLDRELENLANKNMETEDFSNMSTVTSGDYAIVEQTVKEFYKEYSDLKKQFMEKVNDEKIQKMLTVENYDQDGPDFTESKEYINSMREEFNSIADKIVNLLSVENIESRINNKNVSDYYKDLYKSYFIEGDKLSDNLQTSYQDIVDAQNLMNNLYDNETKILDFLTENKEHWEVLNNKLTFDSATLSVEYNTLKTQLYAN